MLQPNFVEKTKKFWDWFSANEEKLSELVKKCDKEDLAFFSEGVALLAKELHFNIGGDHEFTFAVSGKAPLLFLLPYVTANMPERYRKKWKFFPYMPGTGGQNFDFAMHDRRVSTGQVMVSVQLCEERQAVDLRFYAKEWEGLADNECFGAFYILMELNIGEALANMCLAKVERAESLEEGMFPLTSLERWLLDHLCPDGQIPDPAARCFVYEKEPQESQQPRDDIITGIGNCLPILNDYDNGEKEAFQTFVEFGAKPVFIYYYYDGEADRQAVLTERNDIMDKIETDVLGERGSGREIGLMLGSATGTDRVYIDLLLYDEQAFIKKAQTLLASSPYMIFGKEFHKDGQEFFLTDDSVPGFAERLNKLRDCGVHDEIIRIIQTIPADKRDYTLNGIFSCALNNIDEFQQALDVMEIIREQGESDPVWHYRQGYSLLYLDRENEAETALLKAKELAEKDDPVVAWADELLEVIEHCKKKARARQNRNRLFGKGFIPFK